MYCWRMKNLVSVMGLILPVTASSSVMVTVAAKIEPRLAPLLGLLNLTANLSVPSA